MESLTQRSLKKMPPDLRDAQAGDIVFISEKEISNNALFGPFYIVKDRTPIVGKSRKGVWVNIDVTKTPSNEIAYWVDVEKRNWCILFDKLLSERISIVWPYSWSKLNVQLPSWGLVKGDDAIRLIDFAAANELSAREFLQRHNVW